jgi:hypothetical protein
MLSVRWYLRYGLSYRDLEELLAERGIEVDHVTLYRWVQRFTPLLIEAARPCLRVPNTRPPSDCDRFEGGRESRASGPRGSAATLPTRSAAETHRVPRRMSIRRHKAWTNTPRRRVP